ncbi:hypothetical protein GQR58_030082 [Nymphon striatum]|nr:hypothetical protein GQR58_030082 [Nymphon striatum]
MFDLLPSQLPWWIAGPILGVLIVVLFVLANQPLGASGAYVQMSGMVRRRDGVTMWRVWYFVGIFAGGFLVTQVFREGAEVRSGYDALRDAFPLFVVVPMVFAGRNPARLRRRHGGWLHVGSRTLRHGPAIQGKRGGHRHIHGHRHRDLLRLVTGGAL